MAYRGKYEQFAESTMIRYQNAGVMTGDLVKISPKALNHPKLKELGDHVKAAIKTLMDTDLNIRVCGVKSIHPTTAGMADNTATTSPTDIWVDICIERNPGFFSDPVTLPVEVIEVINTGINLAPIPDSMRKKTKVNIKPEEVDSVENRTLPTKNTVLPYTKGSAKQPVLKDSVQRKTEDELLEAAYARIFNAPKQKIFTVTVANAFADNVETFLATENIKSIKTIQGHKTNFDVVFTESKETLETLLKRNVMGDMTYLRVTSSDQQIDERA